MLGQILFFVYVLGVSQGILTEGEGSVQFRTIPWKYCFSTSRSTLQSLPL